MRGKDIPESSEENAVNRSMHLTRLAKEWQSMSDEQKKVFLSNF